VLPGWSVVNVMSAWSAMMFCAWTFRITGAAAVERRGVRPRTFRWPYPSSGGRCKVTVMVRCWPPKEGCHRSNGAVRRQRDRPDEAPGIGRRLVHVTVSPDPSVVDTIVTGCVPDHDREVHHVDLGRVAAPVDVLVESDASDGRARLRRVRELELHAVRVPVFAACGVLNLERPFPFAGCVDGQSAPRLERPGERRRSGGDRRCGLVRRRRCFV